MHATTVPAAPLRVESPASSVGPSESSPPRAGPRPPTVTRAPSDEASRPLIPKGAGGSFQRRAKLFFLTIIFIPYLSSNLFYAKSNIYC